MKTDKKHRNRMTPGVNPDKAWENKVDALIWDGKLDELIAIFGKNNERKENWKAG